MNAALKTSLLALAAAPLLSGCLLGTAVGAAASVGGAVVGTGVDLVTESKEERTAKENRALKKENERLRREQKDD